MRSKKLEHWPLAIGYWLLDIGYWLLAAVLFVSVQTARNNLNAKQKT